ncbi:cupin domain-containing protein [uncultured Pontibacter sp.]|uniref:cupin domain-containing protein n=1 Tax=uncultured Pontibacter sp. TaxID=453356 RepID=UPI0026234CF4|nr:cupin domain-containing protein [uncultured Pontibacter sp.]
MKRSKFIVLLLAAIPLAKFAKANAAIFNGGKGFKVKAGEGRLHGHIQLKGVNANIIDVKVSGRDTDGGLAIFEQTGMSPKRGTPLHVHHYQDEIFRVLEGEYYFQVGEEKHHLKTGDTIFLPSKVPHAWTQVSEIGKMTVIVQPAGKLEDFFLTMAALKGDPSKDEIAKIFAANGMEVVGPPLELE